MKTKLSRAVKKIHPILITDCYKSCMSRRLPKQKIIESQVPDIQYEPPRVSALLEGVVKNRGIKPVKKLKKLK